MAEQGAVGSVIMLITAISVAVMVLIFMGVFSGSIYQQTESDLDEVYSTESKANDTFTALNATAVSLSFPNILSTPVVYNRTNLVASGNFTYNLASGTVTLNSQAYNNTRLNATYQFKNLTIQNTIKSGILKSFEAQQKTGDYLPIIVLAFIIAIVLGIVLSYAMVGGMNGGGRNNAL